MKKKFLVLVLVVSLLLTLSLPCAAALSPETPVSPQWDNISRVTSILTFSGLEGCASAAALKKTGCERIEGTLTVYEYVDGDWSYVDSAYNSVTVGSLGVSVEFTGVPGREYKAEFDVTSYRNGVGENALKIVYETCE